MILLIGEGYDEGELDLLEEIVTGNHSCFVIYYN